MLLPKSLRPSYSCYYLRYYHWSMSPVCAYIIWERLFIFTSVETNRTLADHRVCLCRLSGPEIIIMLLFVGLFSSEVTHHQKRPTPCFLLLIFQKPLIQLCLFIQMLWAKKWSAAVQSWSITLLCMLHSNHVCVYDERSQSMAVLIGT